MIINSHKYLVLDEEIGYYRSKMYLTIKNFTEDDNAKYICSASNSLGSDSTNIQVYGE